MSAHTNTIVKVEHATRGLIEVSAWKTRCRGLVVHRSLGDDGWSVTHRRSGLLIALADYWDEAMLLAARLKVAGDWSRSGADIKADRVMCAKASEIVKQYGVPPHGVTLLHESPAAEAR